MVPHVSSPHSPALPAAIDAVAANGVRRWVGEGGAGGELGADMVRILVIEDDALIAELLSEMLLAMGHDVCAIAATEDDAVRLAILSHPDLLVVDVKLSPGSGIHAVERIGRTGSVAHLFTSGDAAKVRALLPHAVIVQKPYDEAALSCAIAQALSAS